MAGIPVSTGTMGNNVTKNSEEYLEHFDTSARTEAKNERAATLRAGISAHESWDARERLGRLLFVAGEMTGQKISAFKAPVSPCDWALSCSLPG